MQIQSGTARKLLLLVGAIVVVLAAAVGYLWREEQRTTPPVRSFNGTISAKEGNTITVSENGQTYSFVISDSTQVTRLTNPIQYHFITPPPGTPMHVSADTLQVGDYVAVSTSDDLRKWKSAYTADYVNVPAIASSFNGTIVSLANNVVVVKGQRARETTIPYSTEMGLKQPEDIQYEVRVLPTTEISYIPATSNPSEPGKAVQLTFQQLQTGMSVKVYTAVDASTTTKVDALRIEPMVIAQ